jgi:hypothetical protein
MSDESREEVEPGAPRRLVKAVAVDEVSGTSTGSDPGDDGVAVEELPVASIDPVALAPDEVSIVSWRWDINPADSRSRNIATALRYARDHRIRFLLLDKVSLDQTLPKPDLISSVDRFARQFSKLPVIAAYDDDETRRGGKLDHVIARPWIYQEMRHYCTNPTSVTLVRARTQRSPLEFNFEDYVWCTRKQGVAANVLDVIHDPSLMYDVSDYRFIIPRLHDFLSTLSRTLCRNDFLLTCYFLLVRGYPTTNVKSSAQTFHYGIQISNSVGFDKLALERFGLLNLAAERSHESKRMIALDGKPLAIWRSRETNFGTRNWLELTPEFDATLLDGLGIGDHASQYQRYVSTFRESISVDDNSSWPLVREMVYHGASQGWQEIPLSNDSRSAHYLAAQERLDALRAQRTRGGDA